MVRLYLRRIAFTINSNRILATVAAAYKSEFLNRLVISQ